MNDSPRFPRHFLVVIPLVSIALWIGGCSQKTDQKAAENPQAQQNLSTITNLQTAYGDEMKHVLWYERFAKQAQKEGLSELTLLFRALSRSEQVHVDNAARLLKSRNVEPLTPTIDSIPPGKARQYLKMSASTENVEQNMYAGFADVAKKEQFTEAEEWFDIALRAEQRHGRLLKRAVDMEINFARLPYVMCPDCGYIIGSDNIEECPICKAPKSKFQKI